MLVECCVQAAAAHSFQHPGYGAQAQLPSAAGGYPTIDSLRSKLANALLQTKAPVPAAQPQVNGDQLKSSHCRGPVSPVVYFGGP